MSILTRFFPKSSSIPSNNWIKYNCYVIIDPTSIIDRCAYLSIIKPPTNLKTMLSIGKKSQIFSQFNLLTEKSIITIGNNCQIGNVNFNCADSITVGNDVLMAWGITLIDNDSHSVEWKYRQHDAKQSYKDYKKYGNVSQNKDWSHVEIKPIVIKDKVWIGFNSIILKGVTLGEGCVVGAGSVVTKNVPEYTVVGGNPAKVIKRMTY